MENLQRRLYAVDGLNGEGVVLALRYRALQCPCGHGPMPDEQCVELMADVAIDQTTRR